MDPRDALFPGTGPCKRVGARVQRIVLRGGGQRGSWDYAPNWGQGAEPYCVWWAKPPEAGVLLHSV